jgi:hypothetical protein
MKERLDSQLLTFHEIRLRRGERRGEEARVNNPPRPLHYFIATPLSISLLLSSPHLLLLDWQVAVVGSVEEEIGKAESHSLSSLSLIVTLILLIQISSMLKRSWEWCQVDHDFNYSHWVQIWFPPLLPPPRPPRPPNLEVVLVRQMSQEISSSRSQVISVTWNDLASIPTITSQVTALDLDRWSFSMELCNVTLPISDFLRVSLGRNFRFRPNVTIKRLTYRVVAVFDEVNESTAINIDDQIKIMIDGGNNEL